MEDGGTVRVAVSQVLHRPVLVALFFCQPLARVSSVTWARYKKGNFVYPDSSHITVGSSLSQLFLPRQRSIAREAGRGRTG